MDWGIEAIEDGPVSRQSSLHRGWFVHVYKTNASSRGINLIFRTNPMTIVEANGALRLQIDGEQTRNSLFRALSLSLSLSASLSRQHRTV